ncbi:MAG: lysophospholipid acyltransferase family protein [bacterium]
MFKSALIWSSGLLLTVIFSIAVVITGLFDKSGRTSHFISRLWGKTMIILTGVKVKLEGKENLPQEPCILVSNHQGAFDINILLANLPIFFSWIAKKELFKIPCFGQAMKAAHYIDINREDSRQAMKSLKKAALRIKEGCSLIVFPEGTRSKDGKLGEFKRGNLLLASMTKAPIVPVSINGSYSLMRKGSWKIYPGTVTMKIHPPINYRALSRPEQKNLNLKIREIISESLNQYNNVL